jgi:ribonuclease M5
VLHAYIPDIAGKEKRKREGSKEGLLGVEGMSEEIIMQALRDAGCEIDSVAVSDKASQITKTDLYMLGLSGGKDSAELRQKLSKEINIPARISANMLLDVLNRLYTYDELVEIVQRMSE